MCDDPDFVLRAAVMAVPLANGLLELLHLLGKLPAAGGEPIVHGAKDDVIVNGVYGRPPATKSHGRPQGAFPSECSRSRRRFDGESSR